LNLPNVDALAPELCVYLNRQLDPLINLYSLIGLPIKLGSSPDEACTNQLASHQLRTLILLWQIHAYQIIESLISFCFLECLAVVEYLHLILEEVLRLALFTAQSFLKAPVLLQERDAL